MKRLMMVAIVMLLFTAAAESGAAQPSADLPPVVVSSNRQDEEALRIPAHITVITSEDIDQSNATNAGDLLRDEAGLTVANTSGSSPTGIIVDGRGFNNGGGNGGRLLILIDGRRANLVDTSSADWSSIPIGAIERIEITRGSSSDLYGDNAEAGVINIITKKGSQKPSLDGALEAGSYDYWNRNAALSGGGGPMTYYLFGGYETTHGYRENSNFNGSNYVGNFQYKTGAASNLHFQSGYLSNDRRLPGSLTQDEIESLGRDASVTDDFQTDHQGSWDAGYDSQFTANQWLEISGGQTVRGSNSTITYPDSGITGLESKSRSSALYAKYRLTHPVFGLENRLMLGTDMLKETIMANSINDYQNDPMFPFFSSTHTKYTRKLIAAYAHEEFSVLPTVIMTLSGRLDWSEFRCSGTNTDLTTNTTSSSACPSHSFRLFSPKVGLTYLTSPASSLFIVWSRSFRFPNQDELTGLFGFTPELDPERATTLEFGSQAQIGHSQLASLSIYRTDVHNEILYIPPGNGTQFGQNENVPKVRHRGVELSMKSAYSESLRVRASYTLSTTTIQEGQYKNNDLPITPNHAGSATVEWGKRQGMLLSFTGRFSGRRYLANDLANDQEKLPKYAVYSTRLSYASDVYEAFVGISNLFNRKYDEYGGVNGSRIGFYPAAERNYIGGATIRF